MMMHREEFHNVLPESFSAATAPGWQRALNRVFDAACLDRAFFLTLFGSVRPCHVHAYIYIIIYIYYIVTYTHDGGAMMYFNSGLFSLRKMMGCVS